MNIRDLNVFFAVVETKHLTKASKLLYMTPQGISKVIKNLERSEEHTSELQSRI